MKMLFIFRGPCGAGKTYIRKAMKMKAEHGLDMADYDRSAPLSERVDAPANWLAKHHNENVVWIEGIFAPNSPSFKGIMEECEEQGRLVQSITVTADMELLTDRIGEHDSDRLRLASIYVRRFC